MRTPLLCRLRVTISPWNSWPDFLKVPIFAMSLLLGCSSPRPSRPRWRSAGRRRSPPHPSSGQSAAEDGGGETLLAREEWAKPRGRKSRRRHCGTGDRGAAVLWPDQAIRGRVASVRQPEEKTWRILSEPHKRPGPPGEEKETLACRWARPQHAWNPLAQRLLSCALRHRLGQSAACAAPWSCIGSESEIGPTRLLKTTSGEISPLWSARLADQAMSDRRHCPVRHRAGQRAPCVPRPSPPR